MSQAQTDFGKLTVLVVDDSSFMCNMIEAILGSYGCKNVVLAFSVTEALRKLDERPIDLAIVDWFMAPLDGLEFVRRVRFGIHRPNPYLPIIMLTGHSEAERVRKARDAGVNDFLAKPVTGEAVYRPSVVVPLERGPNLCKFFDRFSGDEDSLLRERGHAEATIDVRGPLHTTKSLSQF